MVVVSESSSRIAICDRMSNPFTVSAFSRSLPPPTQAYLLIQLICVRSHPRSASPGVPRWLWIFCATCAYSLPSPDTYLARIDNHREQLLTSKNPLQRHPNTRHFRPIPLGRAELALGNARQPNFLARHSTIPSTRAPEPLEFGRL